MTNCDICQILQNKEDFHVIYEDDLCFALLHESPAIEGHTLVIPKTHTTILEELNDPTVEHLFKVCNKISTILFDKLGAHGTNVIVNNGLDAGQEFPHVVIHVLPRKENDKLDFEWKSKQVTEQSLKAMKNRIQIYADPIFLGKDILPDIKIKKPEPTNHQTSTTEEEDYMVQNLRRLP